MAVKVYDVIIETETPLNISSGSKNNGYVKDLTVKDSMGNAYIPGSSIKGQMRAIFRMLYEKDNDGITDEIFGSAKNPSKVIVDNFLAEQKPETSVRFGNAIDRYRKVTKEGALYSKEVASGVFKGQIEINYDKEIEKYNLDESDFKLVIKMITSIGGSKSTGFGKVKVKFEDEEA